MTYEQYQKYRIVDAIEIVQDYIKHHYKYNNFMIRGHCIEDSDVLGVLNNIERDLLD